MNDESVTQQLHNNKVLADDMQRMMETPGWQRLEKFLNEKMSEAFEGMSKATTGDMALKANAVFVVTRQIRDMPNLWKDTSLQFVAKLEQEEQERAKVPTHNRRRLP